MCLPLATLLQSKVTQLTHLQEAAALLRSLRRFQELLSKLKKLLSVAPIRVRPAFALYLPTSL